MSDFPARQQELLAEIGRRLRASREAKGIAIREVATQTRINAVFLEKIELGEAAGLPGLAFVRGFVRNYMQALGVDDPEILEILARLAESEQRATPPPNTPTTEKLLGVESPGRSWPKPLITAVLVILIVWAGYLVLRVSTSSDTGEPPAATPTAPAAPPPPAGPQTPAGQSSAAPGPAPAASAAAPGARPASAPADVRGQLRLTVRGLEETWVRLTLDRQPAVEVLVHPAETLNFDAEREIHVTVGKSHGVALYLNGEEVALPAEKNRLVADLVLNKLSLLKMQN